MFHPARKSLFRQTKSSERVDVEKANAKSLIDQGVAEAVQEDHLRGRVARMPPARQHFFVEMAQGGDVE